MTGTPPPSSTGPDPRDGTPARAPAWDVTARPVRDPAAAALLRAYFTEIADRWYRLHEGRPVTPDEVEQGLADPAHTSDDLTPPRGVLLVGRYGGEPAGCVGLRVLDAATAELTRMFVRPERRGLGGGPALLAAAEETARGLGAERIVLDTRHDLVSAWTLYERRGYAPIPAYTEGPYAERWYGKRLTT